MRLTVILVVRTTVNQVDSIDLRILGEYKLNKKLWQPVCLHIPEFECANDLGRAEYDLSRTFGSQVPDVVALFNT